MYLVKYYYLKSREITKNKSQIEDCQALKEMCALFLLSTQF